MTAKQCRQRNRMTRRITQFVATAMLLLMASSSFALDNLALYFDKNVTTNGSAIGGFRYDAASDSFWITTFVTAGAQIRNVAWNGSAYAPTGTGSGAANGGHVSEATWYLFKRADDTQTTATPNFNNNWSGSQMTVGNIILNPTAITINGTTHAAGTLALINDTGNNVVEQPGSVSHPELNKHLYWYNLTETFTSTPVGPTNAPGAGTDYNGNGIVDWNDQFLAVITHSDLNLADGRLASDITAQNLARSFAFSSDGQSIYMLDAGSNYGGIYKVDLTTTGSITKVLDAEGTGIAINTEPGVIHTSVRNFGFAGTGDQVVVEGSTGLGNNGGINAYLDNGTTFDTTTPVPVLTAAQFQAFSEKSAIPGYSSITFDAAGNMYFTEDTTTDGIFMLDTAGRLVKIVSPGERAALYAQEAAADGYGASLLDLQARTNTSLGFAITEVFYSDSTLDVPLGILVPKVGDFNFDNQVDATDKAAFLAALATRGTSTTNSDLYIYDLNGSATGSSTGTQGNRVFSHSAIVDWKDVKVLQSFLGFSDGDVNLDMIVDYLDLDTMAANYFTLGGPADKTWRDGDIASIDPFYASNAIDANLVDFTDLLLLAQNWDLLTPTFADLDEHGYVGQFREDVIRAFNITDTPPSATVPEPATAFLGLIGSAVLVGRRRVVR